jgi:hypothetical protein
MKILTNAFDMWIFTRAGAEPRYLLLHTSQEKADRFFGGGRFWQIPGAFLGEDEQVPDVLDRPLDELGLRASAVWAIEHVYPIFNRRFNDMQLIPVFAAEVPGRTAADLGALPSRLVYRHRMQRTAYLQRADGRAALAAALCQRGRHARPGIQAPMTAAASAARKYWSYLARRRCHDRGRDRVA